MVNSFNLVVMIDKNKETVGEISSSNYGWALNEINRLNDEVKLLKKDLENASESWERLSKQYRDQVDTNNRLEKALIKIRNGFRNL